MAFEKKRKEILFDSVMFLQREKSFRGVFLQRQKRIVIYYIKKYRQRISVMKTNTLYFQIIGILIHVLSLRPQDK